MSDTLNINEIDGFNPDFTNGSIPQTAVAGELTSKVSSPSAPLSNDQRRKKLNADVRALGTDAARGDDSWPKLGLRLLEAAADGVISSKPQKDAAGKKLPDDAQHYTDAFLTTKGDKAIHEYGADGKNTSVSKTRVFIKVGEMALTGNQGDPLELARVMVDTRKQMALTPADGKLKSPYQAYGDVCREAIKAKTCELDIDVIRQAMRVVVKEPKTLEEWVAARQKAMNDIIGGTYDALPGVMCQDPEFVAAETALKAWLDRQAAERNLATFVANAEALGLDVRALLAAKPAKPNSTAGLDIDAHIADRQ